MATVVQQIGSSALRGQDAIIHLNNGDQLNTLPTLTVGQSCEVDSSGATGLISSIDYNGNSFHITPTMPSGNLASSSTPGVLSSGETITIT